MSERGRPDEPWTPGNPWQPGRPDHPGWGSDPDTVRYYPETLRYPVPPPSQGERPGGTGGWPPGSPPGHWPAPPPPPRRRRRGPFSALLGILLIVLLAFVASRAGRGWWNSGPAPALGDQSAPSTTTAQVQPPAGGTLSRSELAALGEKVAPGLVDINTELGYQGAESAGTGIVLSGNGEILTNNHVINGATAIQVTDLGDGNTYTASVVGYDRSKDIAVLQLRGASGLSTAELGDSGTVSVGDPVAAVGNAGGRGGPPTVAGGRVTALDQSVAPRDELTGSSERLTGLIEVAANVEPGDSGGPLVDSQGRVIGVDTAASANYRYQAAGGTGFAIPINAGLQVARQIEAGQGSATVHIGPTGMLGVSVVSAPVTRYSSGGGVAVAGVQPGSPAAQAGLGRGDVITGLDGNAVDSATTLTNLLIQHHPGDQVTLRWVDTSGQEQEATVTLVTGPPA